MDRNRDLDQELADRLGESEAPYVLEPAGILRLVENKSAGFTERKNKMIRAKRWKAVLLAAAAVLILTVGAYAANGKVTSVFGSGPSYEFPTYRTLPSAERCRKDVSFDAVLIRAFTNGYTFQSGSVVENKMMDEDNLPVEEYKSLNFRYEKEGDLVYFNQEKYAAETEEHFPPRESRTINGIKVNYRSARHKVVPEGYLPSEEEQKAVEEGELSFGYGDPDEEIRESDTQILLWQIGEIHYSLFQMNGALTPEELFTMAGECIRAE